MSDKGGFRTRKQELERLVREIEDVKNNVRDISATVSRIERHVRRAFDVPVPPKDTVSRKKGSETTNARGETPTISTDDALGIFDDLAVLFSGGQAAMAQERLDQMSAPDLRLLAHELGVTFHSRPSRKSLCSGIIRRLHERALLSKNINILRPQASGETGV